MAALSTADEKDRTARLQLRYIFADGLLAGMDATELREVAAAGGTAVQPGTGEHELREAIRTSNAAHARAAGMPVDGLPTLTTQEVYDLARRLSGEPALPDEPD